MKLFNESHVFYNALLVYIIQLTSSFLWKIVLSQLSFA